MAVPLTGFDADDRFAPVRLAARIVTGGAGEVFSLAPSEYEQVPSAAIAADPGQPVIAATGYGTKMAVDPARAERRGADGLLPLPPCLTEATQEGLPRHIRSVRAATGLGVIVHNRANCRINAVILLRLLDAGPNLVGFRDWVGDIGEFLRLQALAGDRATG